MDTLLLKMAQHASDDQSLMASLIQAYARQRQLTWSQVAAELTVDEAQLARLALCRRLGTQATTAEISQMATYVAMSSTELTAFIRRSEPVPTAPRPLTAPPSRPQSLFPQL